jgi:hypothetical protein
MSLHGRARRRERLWQTARQKRIGCQPERNDEGESDDERISISKKAFRPSRDRIAAAIADSLVLGEDSVA